MVVGTAYPYYMQVPVSSQLPKKKEILQRLADEKVPMGLTG